MYQMLGVLKKLWFMEEFDFKLDLSKKFSTIVSLLTLSLCIVLDLSSSSTKYPHLTHL